MLEGECKTERKGKDVLVMEDRKRRRSGKEQEKERRRLIEESE